MKRLSFRCLVVWNVVTYAAEKRTPLPFSFNELFALATRGGKHQVSAYCRVLDSRLACPQAGMGAPKNLALARAIAVKHEGVSGEQLASVCRKLLLFWGSVIPMQVNGRAHLCSSVTCLLRRRDSAARLAHGIGAGCEREALVEVLWSIGRLGSLDVIERTFFRRPHSSTSTYMR